MARQKYFCGQPTPEGPCHKLTLYTGEVKACFKHGGGIPMLLRDANRAV